MSEQAQVINKKLQMYNVLEIGLDCISVFVIS